MSTDHHLDWDPISAESIADPVAEHRRMRHGCPVVHSEQFGGFWALFRHNDIVGAARDTGTFVSAPTFSWPKLDIGVPWVPLQADPPHHQVYRKIITPFFRGSRLAEFEPILRQYTNKFIDAFIDRGEVDVAEELNIPVPATALCLLMGLPLDNWSNLNRWTVDLVAAGARGDMEALTAVYDEMFAFVDEWSARRRAEPTDDLMSAMLAGEIDGRPLNDGEIQGMFVLLLTAGHETTSNNLSSAMRHLASRPDQRERLRADPDLMPSAVDEFVRLGSPVQGLARTTTRDVEVDGTTIPAGSPVVLMFASGSRDESVFDDADECVLDRDTRKHLSFGSGIHRCIGEPLARIEMRVVLTEWLRRVESWDVAGEPEPAMWPAIGYHKLPITFTARAQDGGGHR